MTDEVSPRGMVCYPDHNGRPAYVSIDAIQVVRESEGVAMIYIDGGHVFRTASDVATIVRSMRQAEASLLPPTAPPATRAPHV